MAERRRLALGRGGALWAAGFALLGAAVVARNLIGLDAAPPGMYIDESSIGYNAWAMAHAGVDEHGTAWPLYFQAFGEYKNPVYIYVLSTLLHFLPLTPAIERLPAAVFGMVVIGAAALAAWRISGSRAIAFAIGALAALTPWITQESRVGFEVISMVALLSLAVWCLAGSPTPRRFAAAGVLLALSIVAYSTGRLEVLLFSAVFLVIHRRSGLPGWWRTLVPVVAGYGIVGLWALLHPGALTAEFSVISIAADHANLTVLAQRFVTNYLGYFAPDFLFAHGDPNLRHNTGYAGMLLVVSLPLLLSGLWVCWQRRGEPFVRFLLICTLLAPISGALTNTGGSAHALRGAVLVPLVFAIAAYGLTPLRGLAPRVRALLAGALVASTAAQGALYLVDLYTAYPPRAATWFDAGVPQALALAARQAAGHTTYVSTGIEQAYIQAGFALQPPPPASPVANSAGVLLRELHMVVLDPPAALVTAAPGDVLVVGATEDQPRSGVSALAVESAPANPLEPDISPAPLVYVYLVTR